MIFSFFLTKELKKFPFFFLLLIITLLLGTTGLIGINLVSRQVQDRLKLNAKELLTSDISIAARRPLLPLELEGAAKAMEKFPHRSYQLIDVYSMVSHTKSGQSRLVEIRGSEAGFPFYGKIQVRDGQFDQQYLFISKDLSLLWNIQKGDEVTIGKLKTQVQGIVEEDSSLGFRGFALAPRVYLPMKSLEETGLIDFGTTGNFSRHYMVEGIGPETALTLRKNFQSSIPDPAVKITLPEDTSAQSGRVINIITNFMSLSALIGMILALVGIFYLYQSHLLARLRDFSLLNLHGLNKISIAAGVILQFTIIFLLVMLLQFVLIIPGYRLLAPVLSANLGLELPSNPNIISLVRLMPALYALALSILIPLLMGLMRTSLGLQLKASKLSMGRFRFYDFLPFVIILWFFSWQLSQNIRTGSIFFFSLLVVFAISTALIRLVQMLLKKVVQGKGLLMPTIESGMALRGLIRSGHKLTLSFLSLCLGATLISLILQLDHQIQNELILSQNKPGLFIFDIQEEQLADFEEFSRKFGIPVEAVTPMIRARLERVNDKPFERKQSPFAMRSGNEENDDPRLQNNAVNLTYRAYLTPSEKIVEGAHFPQEFAQSDMALVSVEKRWSERMGIERGDKLSFDVQGVNFEGKVHNIKEVKWTSFYPNFFITVQPGFLDAAPKNFLAIFPSGQKERKSSFQREAVAIFPNISFIDVEELTSKLAGLFERSRQAIEIISWLSLSVGMVILYGLSHDQVYRRHYDIALMKTLGFSSSRLRLNLIYEFGSLFILSMFLGFFLGWLMASLIGREIFKLGWGIDWSRVIYPGLLLTILCLFTILLASWRAVSSKPRELLSDS